MNGVPPDLLDQTIVDGEALVAKLMTWVSHDMGFFKYGDGDPECTTTTIETVIMMNLSKRAGQA